MLMINGNHFAMATTDLFTLPATRGVHEALWAVILHADYSRFSQLPCAVARSDKDKNHSQTANSHPLDPFVLDTVATLVSRHTFVINEYGRLALVVAP